MRTTASRWRRTNKTSQRPPAQPGHEKMNGSKRYGPSGNERMSSSLRPHCVRPMVLFPSPSGGGRILRWFRAEPCAVSDRQTSRATESAAACSLSLWERVRVRGIRLPCEFGSLSYLLLAAALLGPAARLQAADRDWPVYLGDKASTHFSTLEQINRHNVQRLQVAWTYRSGDTRQDDRSQIQCNPLAIDGVLYGTSPQLKLLSLDAATGRELWRFDPFADRAGAASVGV